MNYAKYWKEQAGEAIRKHNAHIERCNRVIEAGETGLPTGDAAEAADWRTEMERMRTELSNAQSDKKRLEAELEQKTMMADMSARVDEAKTWQRSGRGNGSGAALKADDKVALVDRINRLETALAAAKDENRRLKARRGNGYADLGTGFWKHLVTAGSKRSAKSRTLQRLGCGVLQHHRRSGWTEDSEPAARLRRRAVQRQQWTAPRLHVPDGVQGVRC